MKPLHLHSILERISNGDEEAFNKLFNHYYPKLIQIALAFVPGIVSAQEVVSDLFYKLIQNPKSLQKVDSFDNYIFLAVKNQCYTYLKKNKHKTIIDSLDAKEDYINPDLKNPENSMISDELFNLVEQSIQKLPPKRKAIFILVKEEGKKYKEVAEILDISIKTVELQMSYALKSLRKTVRAYLESKDEKIRPIKSSITSKIFSFFSNPL